MNPVKPTNKNLTWSIIDMKMYNDETGKFELEAPAKAVTLNAKSGDLKAVDVPNYIMVEVRFTAADGYGAYGETTVILAPAAVKGFKVLAGDYAEELVYENLGDYTKKAYKTTADAVMLYPEVTNDTDKTASGLTFTVSNKNFQVQWELIKEAYVDENGETQYWEYETPVVRPVEGAANPYGNVKVTMKTTDGGNVSTHITINFAKPVPAT